MLTFSCSFVGLSLLTEDIASGQFPQDVDVGTSQIFEMTFDLYFNYPSGLSRTSASIRFPLWFLS